MSNRMINVHIKNDRWALKVIHKPNESVGTAATTIIQTSPSSRHQRPQTIVEINSLRSDQSLLIIREHLRQTTRAAILPFERTLFSPILTADIIGECLDAQRSALIEDKPFCSICFNAYEQSGRTAPTIVSTRLSSTMCNAMVANALSMSILPICCLSTDSHSASFSFPLARRRRSQMSARNFMFEHLPRISSLFSSDKQRKNEEEGERVGDRLVCSTMTNKNSFVGPLRVLQYTLTSIHWCEPFSFITI